jgi:2-haloalkanoic acid dehalogenase type II
VHKPELITFDCYGTLIDWNGGITSALRERFPEAATQGDAELLATFYEIQDALKISEYRTYRELLAQVSEALAAARGWKLEEGEREFVAESIPGWTPFPDTNAALERLAAAGYRLGILSNIDDVLLAGTLRHFTVRFDLLVTAQSLESYKPAPRHFEMALAEVGGDSGRMLHVAQSLFHDVRTAVRLGIPVVWVNRMAETRPPDLEPAAEVEDVAGAVDWLEDQLGDGGGA